MSSPDETQPSAIGWTESLFRPVRWVVFALAGVSGVAVLAMMVITCVDVVMRIFHRSLTGAVDLVSLCGAVAIACALPYTTAVRGHVAVEYFFRKLGRRGRVFVDRLVGAVAIVMFAVVCRECIRHAGKLRAAGEASMTLRIPLFWVPYVIALASAVMVLVMLFHLIHPGREMIKP